MTNKHELFSSGPVSNLDGLKITGINLSNVRLVAVAPGLERELAALTNRLLAATRPVHRFIDASKASAALGLSTWNKP